MRRIKIGKFVLERVHLEIDLFVLLVAGVRIGWLLQWQDVKLECQIAKGGYGEVWRGRYRGRWDVAVKKMFDTDDIDTLADESEIHFLQRARHPRLVLFMGAGRMPNRNLFLVLEYVWCSNPSTNTKMYHSLIYH